MEEETYVEPTCPCGELPEAAVFKRPNGQCSACGKKLPEEYGRV